MAYGYIDNGDDRMITDKSIGYQNTQNIFEKDDIDKKRLNRRKFNRIIEKIVKLTPIGVVKG